MEEDKMEYLLPIRHRSHFNRALRELQKKFLIQEIRLGIWSLTDEGIEMADVQEHLGALETAISEQPPPGKVTKRCLIPFKVGELWNDFLYIDSLEQTKEIDIVCPGGDYLVHRVTFSFKCPKCGEQSKAQLECGAKYYAMESDVFCENCHRAIWRVRRGDLVRTRRY